MRRMFLRLLDDVPHGTGAEVALQPRAQVHQAGPGLGAQFMATPVSATQSLSSAPIADARHRGAQGRDQFLSTPPAQRSAFDQSLHMGQHVDDDLRFDLRLRL